MMSSILPTIEFDEHLARLLFITLALTVVLTGGEILGELFMSALIATVLMVLYTTVQAFRYGYLEGTLSATK